MPLINETEIVKRIPVYVKFGRNVGKLAGNIIFENYKEAYYYVEKKWKRSQIYVSPKHKNTLSISEHILDECKKHNVKNAVFMIVGMEKKSFYYIVPIKEFYEGEITDFDDVQRRVRIHGLTRYYPEQEGISKYLT